jgi:hypothetical protein
MGKRYFIFLLAVIMCSLFLVFGQVSTAAGSFYESEPNNVQSAANGPVYVNTIIMGQLTSPADDSDWYKLYCVAGSPVTFDIDAPIFQVGCRIVNGSGTYIGGCRNRDEIYTFTPSYTGYYYIQFYGYPYLNVNYQLKVNN